MNPKAALITVPCGVMGQQKGDSSCHGLQGELVHEAATVELYSGGVLVYTENNPAVYLNGDADGRNQTSSVSIALTGNGTNFKAWYEDASTSWLNSPDLTVKMWVKRHSKSQPQLELFQKYSPVGSVVWAVHSLDAANQDDGLQAEIVRAKAAEAALDSGIAAERAARIASDNALQSSVGAEATRAQAAEAAAATGIGAEKQARIAGDAAVQAALDAEATRAQGAEAGLSGGIAAETARAQGAEAALAGAMGAEVARATAAEAAIQTGLDNEVAARKAGDMALQAAIDSETGRAQAAEAALSTKIAVEKARAQSAEGSINTRVNNEIDRATTAENTLATNLANEGARATAAEAALQGAVAAETTRATGAESAVQAGIAGESAARAAGDAMVLAAAQAFAANAVNAESAARQGADAALQNAIVAEATARAAGDTATQTAAGAYTDSRTPWPTSCPVGQEAVSTGNGTWACASDGSGLPNCNAGQIVVSSGGPNYVCRDICSAQIVDTQTDVNNCGSCGNVCYNTDQVVATGCGGGGCNVQACNGGYLDCNSQWADGCECGNLPNATPGCNGGACAIGQCAADHLDCDQQVGNGCECAVANGTPGCNGGACVVAQCGAGFGDCDHNAANGCESQFSCDNNNCGGCGVVCAQGTGCVMGACVGGGQPVTKTYNVMMQDLINLPNNCGGVGAQYNCNSGGQYGFRWTDTGNGQATAIKVTFDPGLECNGGGNRTPSLNGANTQSFNFPGNTCSCNPQNQGPISIDLTPQAGAYVVNGQNTFLITDPNSCEGLQPTQGNGSPYAVVTVTYNGAPAGGCTPPGIMFTDTQADDVPATWVSDYFQSLGNVPQNYFMYFEVTGGGGTPGAWCAERADWYVSNYLANAPGGGNGVQDGNWNKWTKPQGGNWAGPTQNSYFQYYSSWCDGNQYSWCSNWGVDGGNGGLYLGVMPNRGANDIGESYASGWSMGQNWNVVVRVGADRQSTCGF